MLQGVMALIHSSVKDIGGVDPTMLAVGVGDKSILLWKTQSVRNPFDCNLLWKGLQSKVTVVGFAYTIGR